MADDVGVEALGSLSTAEAWNSGNARASIEKLYERVEQRAIAAIAYYLGQKRQRARWSKRTRALAILFVGLGTLIPLLAAAKIPTSTGSMTLPVGEWGYVAFALAGSTIF